MHNSLPPTIAHGAEHQSLPSRLSPELALDMLRNAPTAQLMAQAHRLRLQRHGRQTYFVHSLNLNPSNVCEKQCRLCAFWREPDANDAFTLDLPTIQTRLTAARDYGLTELHVVGGINSALTLDYYEDLFQMARRILPDVLIQGITAVELQQLADDAHISIPDLLGRLSKAGLGAISGGGAEIFHPDTRALLCPNKLSGQQWLQIHHSAHSLGLPTNATMLFGHIEPPEHIIDHLNQLRALQDQTGGFKAFIPLPFQPANTSLPVDYGPGADTIVRITALARIFLDNFPHIRVLANYVDHKVLQALTQAGADDVGGTSLQERIAAAANAAATSQLDSRQAMVDFITQLGLQPVLVDSAYRIHAAAQPPPTAAVAVVAAVAPGLQTTAGSAELETACASVRNHTRLTSADAMQLYSELPVPELGIMAHQRRQERVDPGQVTFVRDRIISTTNVCATACQFCAFYVQPGAPDAFALSADAIMAKVHAATALGATQIMLQGGLNQQLDLNFYEAIFRRIKRETTAWLHALSPPEIVFLAELSKLTVHDTLQRLIAAGLDSLPGGGAEILVDDVRNRVSPHKISTDQWLQVMQTAHDLGLHSTATMVYGLGETAEQRIQHLLRIRELQDRTGGFTAFIAWSFQSGRTQLGGPCQTGVDYLCMVALARLVLDNIAHIQAGWLTEGAGLAQLALGFGADDFGGVLMEENVIRATGLARMIRDDELLALIRETGMTPVQRTTQYEIIRRY